MPAGLLAQRQLTLVDRQVQIGKSVKQSRESDSGFHQGELLAETEVHPETKAEVMVRGATDIECIGGLKDPWVVVGGCDERHHRRAALEGHTLKRDVPDGVDHFGPMDGSSMSHQLVDGCWPELRICSQSCQLIRMDEERVDTIGDEMLGCLKTTDDQQEHHSDDFLFVEPVAIFLGLHEP